MLKPMAFLFVSPTRYSQKQGPCPKQKHPGPWTLGYTLQVPYPRHAPLSQKCIKCWCVTILWGRPKGSRAPPPDPGSSRTLLGEGRALPYVPRVQAGREARLHHHWGRGLGKLDAVLGWRELGKGAFSMEP